MKTLAPLAALGVIAAVVFFSWPNAADDYSFDGYDYTDSHYDTGYYDSDVSYDSYTYSGPIKQ